MWSDPVAAIHLDRVLGQLVAVAAIVGAIGLPWIVRHHETTGGHAKHKTTPGIAISLIVIIALATGLALDWPIKSRFALSRKALESETLQQISQLPRSTVVYNRWVGLYFVRSIQCGVGPYGNPYAYASLRYDDLLGSEGFVNFPDADLSVRRVCSDWYVLGRDP